MLKFLKNTEIDISLWDECISRSSQSLIYGLSWYLDIIAPQWCAIVKEVKGKYIIAMPLTVRNKLGVNYIFQPVFAQQLGLFSVEDNTETMVHAINYLKEKFILINYNFNIHNTPLLKSTVFAKFTRNRVTHILLLDEKYQTILDKYSATNKRNIKKG